MSAKEYCFRRVLKDEEGQRLPRELNELALEGWRIEHWFNEWDVCLSRSAAPDPDETGLALYMMRLLRKLTLEGERHAGLLRVSDLESLRAHLNRYLSEQIARRAP